MIYILSLTWNKPVVVNTTKGLKWLDIFLYNLPSRLRIMIKVINLMEKSGPLWAFRHSDLDRILSFASVLDVILFVFQI